MTLDTLATFGTIIAAIGGSLTTLFIFVTNKMLSAHAQKMDVTLKTYTKSLDKRLDRLEQDLVKNTSQGVEEREALEKRVHDFELDVAHNYMKKSDMLTQQTGQALLQRLSAIIEKIEQDTPA